MGWWKQSPAGESFATEGDLMWGDGPADYMGNALQGIVGIFEVELQRKPTTSEIMGGVLFALRGLELPRSVADAEAGSVEEANQAAVDALVGQVLEVARGEVRGQSGRGAGEIESFKVKAELEDGLEVEVVFANGAIALYAARFDGEVVRLWRSPGRGVRTLVNESGTIGVTIDRGGISVATRSGRHEMWGPPEALPGGVVYCECEQPVMDPDVDAGCRRCGRPVNFAPEEPVDELDSFDRGWYLTNLRSFAPEGLDYTADEELALALIRHAESAIENEFGDREVSAEEFAHVGELAVQRVAEALGVIYGVNAIVKGGS